jgi:hypothetical protein
MITMTKTHLTMETPKKIAIIVLGLLLILSFI